MTVRWTHATVGAAAIFTVCLLGAVSVGGEHAPAPQPVGGEHAPTPAPQPVRDEQAPAPQPQPVPASPMAEQVFKNIQVLKGIPVDEFLDTMGMFASALGKCCSDCHGPAILYDQTAFAQATPQIQMARLMIRMTNDLNAKNFGGQKKVTCFTCHGGEYRPKTVPSLALQYGEPVEDPYVLEFVPNRFAPSPDETFAKYFEALGGKERLAKLTSVVATGIYEGFDSNFAQVPVEVLAKAPDQQTMIVRASGGNSVRTYDGRNGWRLQLDTPTPLITLTGDNLAGARVEAAMLFPLGLQSSFDQWQSGLDAIGDDEVTVLRGTRKGQTPVNLYFDEGGLLVRIIYWSTTAVGSVPTQIDLSDYRDAAGIKMPFTWTRTWTNGQTFTRLKEIRTNVTIDPAAFSRPVLPN